jgi:hypothetical protein
MNQKNKKRTAVEKMTEWLGAEIGHYVPEEKRLYIQLIISNSKALEKEQIIEAYMKAKLEHIDTLGLNAMKNKIIKASEDYYNETYGGDE